MTRTRKPTCLSDRQEPTEKQIVKNGEAGKASTGQFAEGNDGGPGRPRGSHNRISGELKGDILTAYQERGGIEWLRGLNERLFVQLLTKVMPREITADIRAKVGMETEINWDNLTEQELEAQGHCTGFKICRINGELYFYRDADKALSLDDARMIVDAVEQAKRFKQWDNVPPVAAECLEHTIEALRKHLPELAAFQKQVETAIADLEAAGMDS